MSPEVIEQPFRLTNLDPVMSEADGTAAVWSDIWKYQVPVGVALILKPEHLFSLYLEDTSPAVVGDSSCSVKIEKRDSSGSDMLIAYGPALYMKSKEFQNRPLKARLSVAADGLIIEERQFLVIAALDDAAIDASDSYFELHVAKVRRSIHA